MLEEARATRWTGVIPRSKISDVERIGAGGSWEKWFVMILRDGGERVALQVCSQVLT